jgi:hypothetical protein
LAEVGRRGPNNLEATKDNPAKRMTKMIIAKIGRY